MPRQAGDCRIYREVTAYAPLRNVSRGLHGVTQIDRSRGSLVWLHFRFTPVARIQPVREWHTRTEPHARTPLPVPWPLPSVSYRRRVGLACSYDSKHRV